MKIVGLYKPGNTSYAIYEATLPNGDSHAAGAFSEEEFRSELVIFYGEKVAKEAKIKKMESTACELGWMKTEEIVDCAIEPRRMRCQSTVRGVEKK